MALSGPVCVCVNPAITCRHKLIYIRTLTLEVKAEQGATAPFISPWPTKLLMFGEDMQSDQLHVPANRTVDFCSSLTLFALRISHFVLSPLLLALAVFEFLSSFGSLHVLR